MTPHAFLDFTIIRKLPAGGMGRVFEATDSRGRRVALKLIDRATDPDSMQIVAAERLGVKLHQRLCAADARITAVYGFGETPDYLYIIMEYVDGEDLSELSSRQRIGFPFAARIAQDVLEVLNIAHNFGTTIDGREYRGIVHGDIKPRNIRLTTVGQVKVLDFGIAKALSLTRTFTQNVFGSVQYSSPERLNSGEVTVSSDLWAVGVVLYEMIARRPYFEGDSGPRLERTIRNYQQMHPLPEDCPEGLKQVLLRALAPDPAERYETAREFAEDLRAFRETGVVPVRTFDGEATRRTARGSEIEFETRRGVATAESDTATMASDATRRTSGVSNGNREPAGEWTKPPTAPGAPSGSGSRRAGPHWGRIAFLVFAGAMVFFGALIVKEFYVWQQARQLAREIDAEKIQKLDAAWDRYQALAPRSNLNWSLWTVQSALRNRLLADADRAITNYRNGDGVNEADWMRARASAARALELDPHNKTVRGTLRIIDGHLDRIRGTARRDSKLLQEARANFEEAADLMSKSPDPWLGLVRLDVYSLHDVDAAEAALKEAEKRRYDMGKRDTAQLADGLLYRADRTLKEAINAANQPEQQRYFDLARKDYERARQLYESIIPWGGAAANLRKAYDGLQRIETLKSGQPLADAGGHH